MNTQQRVKGKVAVITGGGSGIGKGAALRLAQHGAIVCLLDRTVENAEAVKKQIEQEGGKAEVFETDISKPEMVERSMNKAAQQFGRIDIVFANAGINGKWAPLEELTPEDWDTTLSINLKGTFLTLKYAVPHLKKNGGSVIITSSVNGNRIFSNTGASAYSSSKAGQVAFMKMTALELATYRIRVNAICPGAIDTNIGENTETSPELEKVKIPVEFPEGNQPLEGHAGSIEQCADLVLFLASNESSHISGTEIYIDGGESLIQG
ncbi:SDR family oxidoreductase [Paenibacillus eucommiae]|uniref:NAD(P)-dependent dehydrogenase (Short-subunit alcohol dehydrogenase family) n=1 Tax=Paenibacillus eucommiae TaxID=1355755 RepID=A0ABS4J006_9BACL|nr:SDR family NAD(P)-dependent oxidoreductase [Paenibacillus eucommiae]MBP1993167.1 NAD(P)-dependent dehydrogenase (short-subunit alcohol dehydrogenase family) [Paenibacillus eucommiae]